MMRALLRGSGWIQRAFSSKPKHRSTSEYLKLKKIEERGEEDGAADLEQVKGAHKILYFQFVPLPILAAPLLYSLQDPSQALCLAACNSIQYYTSGLLCFNAFFTDQAKFYGLLLGIGVANCLEGSYSIVSPLILAAMNLLAPFTDEKMYNIETDSQQENAKIYLQVQGVFYFLVIVLTTLKGYHYYSVKEIERKIDNYQAQNKRFYGVQ